MAGLIGIGQSGLMAAYAQLQTTGHNIANAHTPGYTRQEAVLATAGGRYTGSGFLGSGVDVVTVQRRYDQFLSRELSSQTSAAAAASARAEQLGRLDGLFADTDNGIGAAYDALGAALADLVNRPADPSARQAVLMRADGFAQQLRETDRELAQLGLETNERIAQATGNVNGLLDRIGRLNERIAQSSGAGQPPNDLLDQRDALVVELNGFLEARTYTQPDGTVSVFAAGGEGLVVGNRAARLVAESDPADPQRQRVVLSLGETRLPMNAQSLGGGSLAGLMSFRDDDLPAVRAGLDRLATGVAEAWNRQQALGVDAGGAPGQPMFRLGSAPGGAAAGFALAIGSGAALATGYRANAELASGNAGDLAFTSFAVTDPATPGPAGPVRLTWDAGAGAFAIGDPPGSGGSLAWTPGTPLEYNGLRIEMRGTPANGDSLRILPAANPASDNRNAREMLGLLDKPIVDGRRFGDAFGAMLVDVGGRAQSAVATEAVSQRLLQDAQSAHAAHAGVNLDEEAARLMQFQQMYQAAAKVIQTAQSMFDSLLAMAGR